jgi:hypothetical protein
MNTSILSQEISSSNNDWIQTEASIQPGELGCRYLVDANTSQAVSDIYINASADTIPDL